MIYYGENNTCRTSLANRLAVPAAIPSFHGSLSHQQISTVMDTVDITLDGRSDCAIKT